MAGVRFCSSANSTLFTTCCDVAILDDEQRCPYCGKDVPYSPRERWEMAMREWFGSKELSKMRSRYRDRDRHSR